MTLKYISFILLLIPFISNGQDNIKSNDIKEVIEYYKNGNVKYITPYLNNKIHGEMKWYKKDGRLWYSKNYNNGRPEGEQSYYFKRTTHTHMYKDGVRNKVFHVIRYYKDGSVKEEYNNIFFEGYGQYKLYYKSGNIKIDGNYIKTKRNGIWSFYNKDGTLRKTKEYSRQFVFSFRQFVF